MAIPINWTNGTTGTYDSFGAIAASIKKCRTLQSDLETRRALCLSKASTTNRYIYQFLIDAIDLELHNLSITNAGMAETAIQLLIKETDDDTPLQEPTRAWAFKRFRELMEDDDVYVATSTVGSSVAADAGNTGDGTLVVGVGNPDGEDWQNIRAEKIRVECTRDAQGSTSILSGREEFSVRGEKALDRFDKDWPAGSGIDATINSTCGSEDQRSGPGHNTLKNSDFEDVTANVPDDWTLAVGVAGTDLVSTSDAAVRGSLGLQWVGDGATKTKLEQNLDGTDALKPKPRTAYAFSVWLKDGTAAPTSGVLKVTLADDAGTTDFVNITLSGLTASWVQYTDVLLTGEAISTNPKIQLALSTAIDNGKDMYMDEVVLQECYHPQPGGPYMALAAGGTDFVVDDLITATMTNDWANDTWLRELDRLFDTYGLGLLPMTTGTTLIDTSLIT